VTNKLSISVSLKMAERSEAKARSEAKLRFKKSKFEIFGREASLRALSFASLSNF